MGFQLRFRVSSSLILRTLGASSSEGAPFLYSYTRVRAFLTIYNTRAKESQILGIWTFMSLDSQNTLIFLKKYYIENQRVIKKVHFLVHFFAKIFGQFKKKQYLCTRF